MPVNRPAGGRNAGPGREPQRTFEGRAALEREDRDLESASSNREAVAFLPCGRRPPRDTRGECYGVSRVTAYKRLRR